MWASTPSRWDLLSSAIDLALAAGVALAGVLTPALPEEVLLATFAAALVFSFALDFCEARGLSRVEDRMNR